MASGLPVVATRSGGPEEIVQDGETGLLVPNRDADALAWAISHLLEDRTLCTTLGQAGRLRARSVYSLEAMVDQYDALLNSLQSPAADARQASQNS
jgi:glycosyltransferase involved in cell wall biosynthesis